MSMQSINLLLTTEKIKANYEPKRWEVEQDASIQVNQRKPASETETYIRQENRNITQS